MPQQELAKQQRVQSTNRQRPDLLAHPFEGHHPAPTVAPMPSSGLSQATLQRAQADPHTLAPNDIMQLQRTIGNQAVQRMLNAQAKPALQRDREDGMEVGAGFEAGGDFERQLSRSKGGGTPLPKKEREGFESSFGANFSNVRIHTDAAANQLSRSIQAKAFTHGNDIHFGAGEYNPASSQGKHLLAHELTHTLQQGGGQQAKGVQPKLQVGAANDRYEQEADRVAGSISTSISGHKGGPVGKVQPMAAPAVQRMMKFKPEDLEAKTDEYAPAVAQNQREKVSTKRKVANKLGYESNYQKIKDVLGMYWQVHGDLDMQEWLLGRLSGLVEGYQKNQRHRKKPIKRIGVGRDFKNTAVARLKLAIMVEVAKIPKKRETQNTLKRFHKDSPHVQGIPMIERFDDSLMAEGKQVYKNEKHDTEAQKKQKNATNAFSYSDGIGGTVTKNLPAANKQEELAKYNAQKKLGLTQAHRAALKEYTSNQYMFINPAMADDAAWMKSALNTAKDKNYTSKAYRGDDATITKMLQVNKEMGDVVSSALEALPVWKQTKTLYRGDKVTNDEAAKMVVGYEKRHNYFVSTSQDITTPQGQINQFKNPDRPWGIIFYITESKTGRDVAKFSKTAKELEILFPVDTTFKVTKVISTDVNNQEMHLEVKVL